ncbi:hypothetical protein ACFWJY_00620 [Streptomyces anulatus]|uniref:hypothetical protein n=1 Tax=Streptomyces anulatus TaxID=1892 RepID=UPI003650F9B9
MSKSLVELERRHRRLKNLRDTKQVDAVATALRTVWEEGRKPERIGLRYSFLDARDALAPPATQLLNPRGVALRFYLLAVFEAQCRLAPGEQWKQGSRPLQGHGGWSDFLAVDAGYSAEQGIYGRPTKQRRTPGTSRLRQVHGALRALEKLGEDRGEGQSDQALVAVPRKGNARGDRVYADFSLLLESGRGRHPSEQLYRAPADGENEVFWIPTSFFLRGWAQVLTPAETVTWLVFRRMADYLFSKHQESGLYLYANKREEAFHLLRDSYEEACKALRSYGLIRFARSEDMAVELAKQFEQVFSQPTQAPVTYEPHRYQLVDESLEQDALERCMKELVLRQQELKKRRPSASE